MIDSAPYTPHDQLGNIYAPQQDVSYRTLYWSNYTLTLTLTVFACPCIVTLDRRDNIHTTPCYRQRTDRHAIDQNEIRVALLHVNTEPHLRSSGDCANYCYWWTTLHYYVLQSHTTYIPTVCICFNSPTCR